jgi:uncharacterized Tic20 family protein
MGDPNMAEGTPPPVMNGDKDARTMAMLAHLLGALFSVLGSLIIWLMKKDSSPFVDSQGKEAVNFQLTLLIAHVVAYILFAITCGFLFFLPIITALVQLIMGIIGAMQANNGVEYRYPFCIRFIK